MFEEAKILVSLGFLENVLYGMTSSVSVSSDYPKKTFFPSCETKIYHSYLTSQLFSLKIFI